MAIQIQGGPAINVVPDASGARVEGGAAIPVAVVTDGRAVSGNKATRVVVVTNPDHVEGGAAIPIVAAAAGDVAVEGGPAMRVYVVQGSLGGVAPVNTAPPTISGTTELAATLTGNHGTYTGSPTSYTYRWLRAGVAIGGATANTYVLVNADLGTTITFEETASNAGGAAAPATSAGTAIPNWLLLDHFTTAQVAPLISPRNCEPGPGTLTITDPNNVLSIATGRLAINGTPAGANDGFIGAAITRAIGRALAMQFPTASASLGNGNDRFGWVSTNTIGGTEVSSLSTQTSTDAFIFDPGGTNFVVAGAWSGLPGVAWEFAVVLRSTGAWCFVRQGAGNWTLVWVASTNNTTPVYPRARLSANAYNVTLDDFRVVDLGSPFDTDYGFATNRVASPANPQATTMIADALVEFTWTAATGETLELDVRRTDVNNRWCTRCSQAGSTIKLIEINAGVETERATAAQTFLNTGVYRIVVMAYGTNIRSYVNAVQKNIYASATLNQTATGVNVAGGATGSNLVAWPRSVTLPNY